MRLQGAGKAKHAESPCEYITAPSLLLIFFYSSDLNATASFFIWLSVFCIEHGVLRTPAHWHAESTWVFITLFSGLFLNRLCSVPSAGVERQKRFQQQALHTLCFTLHLRVSTDYAALPYSAILEACRKEILAVCGPVVTLLLYNRFTISFSPFVTVQLDKLKCHVLKNQALASPHTFGQQKYYSPLLFFIFLLLLRGRDLLDHVCRYCTSDWCIIFLSIRNGYSRTRQNVK